MARGKKETSQSNYKLLDIRNILIPLRSCQREANFRFKISGLVKKAPENFLSQIFAQFANNKK